MDDSTISAVVGELSSLLAGRSPGKIFQLNYQSLAIDFGLREHGYLFISIEPAMPRLYLIKRRLRDLEKASIPLTPFSLSVRKELARTTLTSIEKLPSDRVVTLKFHGLNELGQRTCHVLILQLTGRSANLFLLSDADVIIARSRETKGHGQSLGEEYQPPQSPLRKNGKPALEPIPAEGESVSEALDRHFTSVEAGRASESRVATARAQLTKEISRRQKLLNQLERDLAEHAKPEEHKRIGDLLLANVGAAQSAGGRVRLIDYFADGAPEIEIDIDEKRTIPEEAAYRFSLYSRSKRARVQIARRIKQVQAELAELEIKRQQLEQERTVSFAQRTFDSSPALQRWDLQPPHSGAREAGDRGLIPIAPVGRSKKRQLARIPGVRRYLSSDGYEILVGRAARDNDTLTFKVAKPNDLWLHAVDYPGSHVIVRNPTRKELPQRTLFEAAQLAAYFSQANKDPKVDVHYTERKFLSKPKGAAAGLVRMSRFKSLTVAPAEVGKRVL